MSPKVPTQADVAGLAGVSTATVSYVLSGRRDRKNPVTPVTRDRVLSAAARLGYHRNHAARSFRRRRTELVCVVYRPPDNPWLERLTDQLQTASAGRGYAVMMLPVTAPDRAAPVVRVLGEHVVDGAIVAPGSSLPATGLGALARGGLALAVFDDELEPKGFDVVRQQAAAGCRAAVEHLIELGHTRIAHLAEGSGTEHRATSIRYAGYHDALTARGLPVDDSLVRPGADSRTDAYVAARDLFDRPDRPTALFAATDRAAISAIWAIRELGLRVPDDVAVTSVGNTGEGEVFRPRLTTAGVPTHDFTSVIDRLFDRIDAEVHQPGQQIQLGWDLIVRESSTITKE